MPVFSIKSLNKRSGRVKMRDLIEADSWEQALMVFEKKWGVDSNSEVVLVYNKEGFIVASNLSGDFKPINNETLIKRKAMD